MGALTTTVKSKNAQTTVAPPPTAASGAESGVAGDAAERGEEALRPRRRRVAQQPQELRDPKQQPSSNMRGAPRPISAPAA